MQRFRVPGHDAVANLVLDDVQDSTCTCRVQHVCVCVIVVAAVYEQEYLRDPEDPYKVPSSGAWSWPPLALGAHFLRSQTRPEVLDWWLHVAHRKPPQHSTLRLCC